MALDRLDRIKTLPLAPRLGVLVPALAVGVYWCVTYSGPYRILSELQLSESGRYSASLSAVAAILCALLPALGLLMLLAGPEAPESDPPTVEPDDRAERLEAWIRGNYFVFVLGMIAVGLIGTGLYFHGRALYVGERTVGDIAALERGDDPQSRWLQVAGSVQWGESVAMSDDIGERLFAPIRSGPGARAALLVEIKGAMPIFGRETWTGTLYRGPPGLVRTEIATKGLAIAEDAWVLEVDQDPSDLRGLGWVMSGVGGGAGVLLALILFRRRRQRSTPGASGLGG